MASFRGFTEGIQRSLPFLLAALERRQEEKRREEEETNALRMILAQAGHPEFMQTQGYRTLPFMGPLQKDETRPMEEIPLPLRPATRQEMMSRIGLVGQAQQQQATEQRVLENMLKRAQIDRTRAETESESRRWLPKPPEETAFDRQAAEVGYSRDMFGSDEDYRQTAGKAIRDYRARQLQQRTQESDAEGRRRARGEIAVQDAKSAGMPDDQIARYVAPDGSVSDIDLRAATKAFTKAKDVLSQQEEEQKQLQETMTLLASPADENTALSNRQYLIQRFQQEIADLDYFGTAKSPEQKRNYVRREIESWLDRFGIEKPSEQTLETITEDIWQQIQSATESSMFRSKAWKWILGTESGE